MRIFQTNFVQKTTTHVVMFSNFFGTLYKIKCKNTVEPDRQQMKILRMRIACFITKAANTHCTPRICKKYCLSTAKMVKQMSVVATLYVHCLSSFFSRKWEISCLVYSSRKWRDIVYPVLDS